VTVTVESSRFGTVEVDEAAVVEFARGLIGIGGRRYALLARDAEDAIAWLHSLEDPDLAVPVVDPFAFFTGYEVELSDADAEELGVSAPSDAQVLVTVRVGPTPEECFANLKAPILVAGSRGAQVINEADAPLRAPLLGDASGAGSGSGSGEAPDAA
jgi:flagellar assembly factor FliW